MPWRREGWARTRSARPRSCAPRPPSRARAREPRAPDPRPPRRSARSRGTRSAAGTRAACPAARRAMGSPCEGLLDEVDDVAVTERRRDVGLADPAERRAKVDDEASCAAADEGREGGAHEGHGVARRVVGAGEPSGFADTRSLRRGNGSPPARRPRREARGRSSRDGPSARSRAGPARPDRAGSRRGRGARGARRRGSSPSRSRTSPASNPLVAAEAPGTTSKTTNRWSGARYTLKPGAESGCPVMRARMPARTSGVTSPTWAVRAARVIAVMTGQGDGAPATAALSQAPSRSGSPPHPSGSAEAGVSGREASGAEQPPCPIARGSAGTMLVRTRATYARCTTRGATELGGAERRTAPGAARRWRREGLGARTPVLRSGVTPRPRFDAQPGRPAAASAPSSRRRGAREDIPRTLARPGGSGR